MPTLSATSMWIPPVLHWFAQQYVTPPAAAVTSQPSHQEPQVHTSRPPFVVVVSGGGGRVVGGLGAALLVSVSAGDGKVRVGVPVVDRGPFSTPNIHIPYRRYLVRADDSLVIVDHAAHVLSDAVVDVPPVVARNPGAQEVDVVLAVVLCVDGATIVRLPRQLIISKSRPLVI